MKNKVLKYVLAILGGAIVGLGTGWILLPLKLSTGGFSGIAILVHYLFNVPAGIVTLVLNIPLFLVAIKMLGIQYSFRTFASMLSLSLALTITERWSPLTSDLILASIFGGAIVGVGLALSLRGEATTGGTDLIAKLIQVKKPYLNLGEILLIIDGLIIAISSFTFESIEVALYSGIAVFVMTKIMDLILEGGGYAKAMFIITDKEEEISEYIINEVQRSATKIEAQGIYSKKDKNILLCVANKREIPKIKNKIKEIDSGCFIIITTVTEAIGTGF